jgi:outer membrane protein
VIRLYTDLVALVRRRKGEAGDRHPGREALSDVRAQVEEGTLAQVEMTRANAQVFSTRQDLINARGLREEQEAIFKNVLTRRGNEDPEVAARASSPPTP